MQENEKFVQNGALPKNPTFSTILKIDPCLKKCKFFMNEARERAVCTKLNTSKN